MWRPDPKVLKFHKYFTPKVRSNIKKAPLQNVTFIIPFRATHMDYLINARIALAYLLKYFDTNIIMTENGPRSHREEFNIPETPEFKYIFQKSNDTIFHRTKILNEMITQVRTKIVVNYDIDICLPVASYIKATELIVRKNHDVVLPFSNPPGVFYIHSSNKGEFEKTLDLKTVHAMPMIRKELMRGNPDVLMNGRAGNGYAVFFKTRAYIKGGMENEKFISYGPEDNERIYRFKKLGYKVGNIIGPVYHLEHARTPNSNATNPYFKANERLWNNIRLLSKDELAKYYKWSP